MNIEQRETRGKFITIEGQDGAGKSTNISVIESLLAEHDIDYISTREPGGTQFGEALRELLLQSRPQDLSDMAELLILFAARAQHIKAVIEPALKSGTWVVCDRFTDATYAYQGGGSGLDKPAIAELEQSVQGDLKPDLTLLLDLPVDLGEQRAGQRSKADRFEQEQIDFKQRVRDTYCKIASSQPQRVKLIDASQSLQNVEESVRSTIIEFINHD